MRLFFSIIVLFCFVSINGFENDTVITIEPRFFFKELFQIWSLYFFRSKPIVVAVDGNNLTDLNGTVNGRTTKNVSTGADGNSDDQKKVYGCLVNRVNYWTYKSGAVRIPVVLQMDRDRDKGDRTAAGADKDSSSANGDNVTDKAAPENAQQRKRCTFILIYAKWCRFSAQIAPFFNALGRIFPQLEFVALPINDFQEFKWNLHTSYVPRIKLYYGQKPVREYSLPPHLSQTPLNTVHVSTPSPPLASPSSSKSSEPVCSDGKDGCIDGDAASVTSNVNTDTAGTDVTIGTSDQLDALVDFVFSTTGELPYLFPQLIREDYSGPVSSQVEPASQFWLVVSWILTIGCSLYLVLNTARGRHALCGLLRCFR